MRNIYPKLITTLFLILLTAVIVRYSDSSKHPVNNADKTAHLEAKKH